MPIIEIKQINVPDLGMQTEEIRFGQWLINIGDTVEAGDDLFEVEADKATVVCEAEYSGVLVEQLVTEGIVESGDVIGAINVG